MSRIKRKSFFRLLILIIVIGLLIPQKFTNPVLGSRVGDYNAQSFWYYPWGKSGTHKGIDIFGKTGQEVVSSTYGIVLYSGYLEMGGQIVWILGPKWRLHYYAHLDKRSVTTFSFIASGSEIGEMGTSGNAKGKQPHLHYSITSLVPYPWRIDNKPQGWKKMFYLNPGEYMELK